MWRITPLPPFVQGWADIVKSDSMIVKTFPPMLDYLGGLKYIVGKDNIHEPSDYPTDLYLVVWMVSMNEVIEPGNRTIGFQPPEVIEAEREIEQLPDVQTAARQPQKRTAKRRSSNSKSQTPKEKALEVLYKQGKMSVRTLATEAKVTTYAANQALKEFDETLFDQTGKPVQ